MRLAGKQYKRMISGACFFAIGLIAAGCTSLPEVYIPSRVGSFQQATPEGAALKVEIEANEQRVSPGEPIRFRVRIVNRSEQDIWVPVDPDIVFLWVYPDGSRDNHVRDLPAARHFSTAEVARLAPGAAHEIHVEIRTDYFPRTGIVEFRALMNLPCNTNPAVSPFPSGLYSSNRYGVFVGSVRSSPAVQASLSASMDSRAGPAVSNASGTFSALRPPA